MAGVKFIEQKNKRILLIDLAQCDLESMVKVIKRTKALISQEPPKSVLALSVVSGIRSRGIVSRIAKEFTEHNKPFIKASAIVGLDADLVSEFEQIMHFSNREFKIFQDINEALDWLVVQ